MMDWTSQAKTCKNKVEASVEAYAHERRHRVVDKTYRTLGQLLRALRTSAGLTQPQLADKAKVAISTLSRMETDKLVPGPGKVAAIMRVLNATPEQLGGVGQHDAAKLLSTGAEVADSHSTGQDSPYNALVNATVLLHAAGWAVTTRQADEPGRIVMVLQLPPGVSARDGLPEP